VLRQRRALTTRFGGLHLDRLKLCPKLADTLHQGQVALAVFRSLKQAEVFGQRRAHLGSAALERRDALGDAGQLGCEFRPQALKVLVHVGRRAEDLV